MIFHSFENQEERRKFGGSAFIELQYCTLKPETGIKKTVKSHGYWADSSLYIHADDIDRFCSCYGEIFGKFDVYGVNYYTPAQVKDFVLKIEEIKPMDYEIILNWLKNCEHFNGFYILGI
ncbi:MAG: hypothetical protein ACI4MH_01380 [Candidatus Coproplasma sp.]